MVTFYCRNAKIVNFDFPSRRLLTVCFWHVQFSFNFLEIYLVISKYSSSLMLTVGKYHFGKCLDNISVAHARFNICTCCISQTAKQPFAFVKRYSYDMVLWTLLLCFICFCSIRTRVKTKNPVVIYSCLPKFGSVICFCLPADPQLLYTMSPSPIRCRGPWKIHKRSSEPDRWLDEMGFFRKHTARDSSCLFRAVSENVYNTQRYFHKVRLDCVQYMASKRHLFEGVG